MYIIKVKRYENHVVNMYSCDNFEIFAAELSVTTAEGTRLHPLGEKDSVFIMDTAGNTLDRFTILQ